MSGQLKAVAGTFNDEGVDSAEAPSGLHTHAEKHPQAEQADLAVEVDRLRAQLIQAEKLANLGYFVAGIIHELNNPLTAISACSSALRHIAQGAQAGPLAATELKHIERIEEALERVFGFTQELASYARPSLSPQTEISIFDVIDKALSFCDHIFRERDIRVVRRIRPDTPSVLGLESQLIQVFINLFTNAAQAMDRPDGEISIRTRTNRQEKTIEVEVADNGDGIDAAHIDRIFEPFFTTKQAHKGSGLGLSIAHDIIVRHNGNLEVKSEIGKGTVFRVTLVMAHTSPTG